MPAELERLVNQPERVQAITKAIFAVADRVNPVVDFGKPYVDGLNNLPRDGRFLLVGNHTTFGMAEIVMIPYFVHRELGVRVRGLAEKSFGDVRGVAADVLAAAGAVVGTPANATALMANDETILVFPGGGREMPKFKGEEYRLSWQGRSGFARLAIAHDYPIVPVGLVGGDDVYHGLVERDSAVGRVSQFIGRRIGGRPDMAIPPTRGLGPTLLPDPKRMYLRFALPIDTTKPARTKAETWEATVKERTQSALEGVLADLQTLRETDPFRNLNPLGWSRAVQPESAAP
ncbi:acyltransferase family protein [Mycobacterium sp. NBC_00419]|uniref:lysophospholipid acyltransferase family protein n=1 Tax=Mycobacterium sp. NBC_00419 TaxID=2975989 RepID=UPI002E24DF0B